MQSKHTSHDMQTKFQQTELGVLTVSAIEDQGNLMRGLVDDLQSSTGHSAC